MTNRYKFERFARDCGYNEEAAAKGYTLIYDFRVMQDGEHVATFCKGIGKGYELYDRTGRAIVEPGRTWSTHLGAKCGARAGFAALLDAVTIPTAADCAARDEREAAEALARRRKESAESYGRALAHLEAAIRERLEIDLQGELDGDLLRLVKSAQAIEAAAE